MSVEPEYVQTIVSAAGGRLIGKTRLQKTAYILEISGLGPEASFTYYYYGPYSSELSSGVSDAKAEGMVEEREEVASWGGLYSVFLSQSPCPKDIDSRFVAIVDIASKADAVALELSATAAFLKLQGHIDPWQETSKRKPDKATPERISAAKTLWEKFLRVESPKPLPSI